VVLGLLIVYDDEYHYRDAERGTKYIVAKISISADNKDHTYLLFLVLQHEKWCT
jgi:hypothetical protein